MPPDPPSYIAFASTFALTPLYITSSMQGRLLQRRSHCDVLFLYPSLINSATEISTFFVKSEITVVAALLA